MKVLFVYRFEHIEALGIMQLSSMLKLHGHDVDFIDLKFERDVPRAVREIGPDILAYSVTTGMHRLYEKLNRELKSEFDVFSVFGGPHCTYFPEFIESNGVDAICVGEGEHALPELVDALQEGADVTSIPNIWVKAGNTVHRNDVRPLLEDLDSLPFPDRELCCKYNHYRRMHTRYLLTGRGCPFVCTFCYNPAFNRLYRGKGKIVRRRSVGNVIEELRRIRDRFNTERFCFHDDTFSRDRRWVLDFCEAYGREIGVPFDVSVRANVLSEELVIALKRAGCTVAAYSVESGNERIRQTILKKKVETEDLVKAGRMIRAHGLKLTLQNMLGLPDETLEMAYETLRLNIRIRPSYGWASIYRPFPRTEAYEYSKRKGYLREESELPARYFAGHSLNTKDSARIERLHHLFSVGVQWPFLVPLIRLLVHLPLTELYRMVWLVHKAHYYLFRARQMRPYELFIRERRSNRREGACSLRSRSS